jgi:hypothetical protein
MRQHMPSRGHAQQQAATTIAGRFPAALLLCSCRCLLLIVTIPFWWLKTDYTAPAHMFL